MRVSILPQWPPSIGSWLRRVRHESDASCPGQARALSHGTRPSLELGLKQAQGSKEDLLAALCDLGHLLPGDCELENRGEREL